MKHPALFLAAMFAAATAHADEWSTSWYAAPMPIWGAEFSLPTMVPPALEAQTMREVIRTSVGGKRVRVTYSNRYGSEQLIIGEARIASTSDEPAEVASSSQAGAGVALSFNGRRGITIAPGQSATSDPADLPVSARQRLTVSTWLPSHAPVSTFHWGAQQTAYFAAGNQAAARDLQNAKAMAGRVFLTAVQVSGQSPRGTVVAFGDSITDGNGSTPDRNRRWPDQLAERADGLAVVNAGISGARLLADGMGEKALARFEQDVLTQPGVDTVIVLLGINDIGWPGSAFAPGEKQATASALIDGYRRLIAAARARKIRIIGGTLLPFEGALHGTPYAGHFSAAKDGVRREVNEWIRNSGEFDAVIDFDRRLRDPVHTSRLRPDFDSGDHLHPGDAGYAEMASAAAQAL